MDYVVVQGESLKSLEFAVVQHLRNGYKCQGGVYMDHPFLNSYPTLQKFYQAMVKES